MFSATYFQRQNERLKKKLQLLQSQHVQLEKDTKDLFLIKHKMEQNFYVDDDGTKVYSSGISLTAAQQISLDLIPNTEDGDSKYVYTLLMFAFGNETLSRSTLTGRSKSNQTKEQLDPVKIQCIRCKLSFY
jgi:BEN domain